MAAALVSGGAGRGKLVAFYPFTPAATTTVGLKPSGDTTGATDYTNIAALISADGEALLGPGTFYTNQTIKLTANQSLIGSGVGNTTLTCAVDTVIVQMGNVQSDHVMRNWMLLADMTIAQTNGTQTHGNVYINGGGRGTSIQRVSSGGGKYCFQLEDLDRCYFEDISANNPVTAGIFLEVGFENTYGTCTFVNCDTVLSNNSTYGWYVAADADQLSPNAPDRLTWVGCMSFMTTGLTGCIGFYDTLGMTSATFEGCLFEQNIRQFRTDGTGSTVSFIGCTFLDANNAATDIAYLNGSGTFTFRDCRFQQATNCFNAVSHSPSVCLEGKNNNQGNITNLFTGTFTSKMGTDTVFAGSGILASGLNNQPYGFLFCQNTGYSLLQSNLVGGGNVSQGSGAPSKPNGVNPVAGDIWFRTDTPSTANQRIYICTTGGGTPVWSGIV